MRTRTLVWSVGPGLAARIAARAGSVAKRSLATATTRSDKRAAPALCFCMLLLFVRYFAARFVPRHVLAFRSFIRPLCRSTSNYSRYPVKITSQCPPYATPSLEYPDTRLEWRPLVSRQSLVLSTPFLGIERLVTPCQPSFVCFFSSSVSILFSLYLESLKPNPNLVKFVR